MLRALMRSMRDRPDPFSITSSGIVRFCRASQRWMTSVDCRTDAGLRPISAPMVRKSWRAITLFEYLSMSCTTSASVGP